MRAIEVFSARFDPESNRILARTVNFTQELIGRGVRERVRLRLCCAAFDTIVLQPH